MASGVAVALKDLETGRLLQELLRGVAARGRLRRARSRENSLLVPTQATPMLGCISN
jgi:hypothetical protein